LTRNINIAWEGKFIICWVVAKLDEFSHTDSKSRM
jgi:hypothetical protein